MIRLSEYFVVFCLALGAVPGLLAQTLPLPIPTLPLPQATSISVYIPPDYSSLQPPPAGSAFTDPVFGSTIKRLSNATLTPDAAGGSGFLRFISDEYASMTPFNQDNSRILLQHFSYFGLYDGAGNFIKNLPFTVCAGCEPRWSRTNPNVLYFINGNRLLQLDVSTNGVSVVHTFSEYSTISGKGESDICFDGNHFVFAGDNRYVFVYEISTGAKGGVFDTAGHGFDSLYITPDDNVLIGWYDRGAGRFNGTEMFDRNMNFVRHVANTLAHMDVTRDVNGDEVLVWANAADPAAICQNGYVKIRLADASQTCLVTFDWSLAHHVSCPDSGGYCYISTYAPGDPSSSNWALYTNEIIRIKLDGAEKLRLAHHRSRPFDSYNYTPRASVSRDGKKMVFSSNFGLQSILGSILDPILGGLLRIPNDYTDAYLMDLPAAPGSASTPPPTSTPPEQH